MMVGNELYGVLVATKLGGHDERREPWLIGRLEVVASVDGVMVSLSTHDKGSSRAEIDRARNHVDQRCPVDCRF